MIFHFGGVRFGVGNDRAVGSNKRNAFSDISDPLKIIRALAFDRVRYEYRLALKIVHKLFFKILI